VRFSSRLHSRFVLSCAVVLAGAAVILGSAAPARAVPASFAQFSEASPGGNLFTLLGGSPETDFGTSTGGPLGAPIPVNFTYLTVLGVLPVDLQGVQAATLAMTSSTTLPVTTGFGGTVGAQTFNGAGSLSNSIAITRNTPAAEGFNTKTNLLTVTFTNSTLLGILGSSAPQMSADTATAGVTVNYSSDFLTFPNGEHNFSLTFSSWSSIGDNGGPGGLQIGGVEQALFFLSATAAGAGTFGGNAIPVPEPSSILIAALGLIGLIRVARRS